MKNLICFQRDSFEHRLILGTELFCINPDDSSIFLVNGSGELVKLLPSEITSSSNERVSVVIEINFLFIQIKPERTIYKTFLTHYFRL